MFHILHPAHQAQAPRLASRRPSPLEVADQATLTADIRTGILSWAEIGRRYGVSEAAVRQWAKRHEVRRGDLQDSVRAATRAMVSGTVDRQTVETAASNAVAVASAAQFSVVVRHRADLEKMRRAKDESLVKLELMVDQMKNLGDAVKFFSALEAATRTTRHLIDKERQAFGIQEGSDGEDDGTVNVVIKRYAEP